MLKVWKTYWNLRRPKDAGDDEVVSVDVPDVDRTRHMMKVTETYIYMGDWLIWTYNVHVFGAHDGVFVSAEAVWLPINFRWNFCIFKSKAIRRPTMCISQFVFVSLVVSWFLNKNRKCVNDGWIGGGHRQKWIKYKLVGQRSIFSTLFAVVWQTDVNSDAKCLKVKDEGNYRRNY